MQSYNYFTKSAPGRYACAFFASILCSGVLAQSDDTISRQVLIDMAQSQYQTLCASETFARCMGFTGTQCTDLADSAIKQCLSPLPESILTEELDNEVVEACPAQVFADAGFTEDKAALCFDEAMEADAK